MSQVASAVREDFVHGKPGVLCKILSAGGSVWFWGPVSYTDSLEQLRSQSLGPWRQSAAGSDCQTQNSGGGGCLFHIPLSFKSWQKSKFQKLLWPNCAGLTSRCCGEKTQGIFKDTWAKLLPDFNPKSEIWAWNLTEFPAFIQSLKN